MVMDIIDRVLFKPRLKWYPLIHSFSCGGDMVVYIPKETCEDKECFMKCDTCGARYHMANVEPDDESASCE